MKRDHEPGCDVDDLFVVGEKRDARGLPLRRMVAASTSRSNGSSIDTTTCATVSVHPEMPPGNERAVSWDRSGPVAATVVQSLRVRDWLPAMKLAPTPIAAPAVPAPAPPAPTRRAPSSLTTPSLDDASAAASASLDQVASYVGLLQGALSDDTAFYERLVKRGFLDNAIDYTKYALAVMEYDKSLDNDGFDGIVEGAVLEGLLAAKSMGTPAFADPNLVDELSMAKAAATNAADGLALLAARK
jgi:hypothetical protein